MDQRAAVDRQVWEQASEQVNKQVFGRVRDRILRKASKQAWHEAWNLIWNQGGYHVLSQIVVRAKEDTNGSKRRG